MNKPNSIALQYLYTHEYYMHGVAGHEAFRSGNGGLGVLINVRRAHALALASHVVRATDIGSGRGELAKYLVDRSVAVTLVDYSAAAMAIAREHVGNDAAASYLTINATELDQHIPPASQDLIFMCDFAEHVSSDELRGVLRACRCVLAPDGVLCLHSPERTTGAVLTQRAVETRHINLMDISGMRAELGYAFGYAEAFTWNGHQAFYRPGCCIDLFGVARAGSAYPMTKLPMASEGVFRFPDACGTVGGFLLRCDVVAETGAAVPVRFRFLADDGRPLVEHGFDLEGRPGEPRVVLLASRLLGYGRRVRWTDLSHIELRLEGKERTAYAGTPVAITARGCEA